MAKPKGGRREGAGRPKGATPPPTRDKTELLDLYDALCRPPKPNEPYHVKKFRELTECEDPRIQLDAWKYLKDHKFGKATQPVDHGAGGPIEVSITTNVKMPARHE